MPHRGPACSVDYALLQACTLCLAGSSRVDRLPVGTIDGFFTQVSPTAHVDIVVKLGVPFSLPACVLNATGDCETRQLAALLCVRMEQLLCASKLATFRERGTFPILARCSSGRDGGPSTLRGTAPRRFPQTKAILRGNGVNLITRWSLSWPVVRPPRWGTPTQRSQTH